MPTVAIGYTEERGRSLDHVYDLLRETVDHLGGISGFVRPGETVLIKPDQSVPYAAEEGATTDPTLVAALVRLVKRAGATKVFVGDSSGSSFNSMACMDATGMAEAVQREGAEVVDLGRAEFTRGETLLPQGKVLKRAPIPDLVLEADAIIAAPKAKTHYVDHIAGALYGWTGIVNPDWRTAAMEQGDAIEGAADLMAFVRPELCIVDALICGEGDGPAANSPRWCGAILASTDPVAADISIARLMKLEPAKLRLPKACEERGIGSQAPLIWKGMPIDRIAFRAWPAHEGYGYLPVNFLVGTGVRRTGTIGHVKNAIDRILRRGTLREICARCTPTVMIGAVEDPEFERHLKEGPYLVFDDSALPVYKDDPRVRFVPGHPVTHADLAALFRHEHTPIDCRTPSGE